MGCCCGPASRRVILKIQGMSCEHCKRSVEAALKGLDGVEKVAVDVGGGEAVVDYYPARLTVEELKKAVVEAGYEVSSVVQ
ncbi:MAG: cation transporter [Thermanaeromonas sp.]|uniref:heavy-metal-associated domain-containing protein n=1 Tax=Thermanaeromonas sp. TaxID=2003697 RepID=UPI00243F2368|nr:cation transporter [Thermanaeromonas sp.]MCG0277379.1 cation transporter [Thermanaeromonas sp.]